MSAASPAKSVLHRSAQHQHQHQPGLVTPSPVTRSSRERLDVEERSLLQQSDHLLQTPATGGATTTSGPTTSNAPFLPFTSHFSLYDHATPETPQVSRPGTPVFGDPRGIALVAEICKPSDSTNSGHFPLPRAKVHCLAEEELSYLRLKGVFWFPETPICDALVRAYFHYVHPFFPIIDVGSFLTTYESAKPDELGIHLLWSVFLAATHFLDDDVVRAAGFQSRKDMKRSMYQKSKALYDMQYEPSKTKLIQAVLLMGFWYPDTEDRLGPWHWIGVAISLCQTSGLHRIPDLVTGAHLSKYRETWQTLWWACVYRETWFSIGQGKPMRINFDDCDTEMPTATNYELTAEIPHTVRTKYLPAEMNRLSQLWVDLLKLTVALAKVISTYYRARKKIQRGPFDTIEQQILACCQSQTGLEQSNDHVLNLHIRHFELYANCVLLMFYRPFLVKPRAHKPDETFQQLCSVLKQKAQAAAARFNMILVQLITEDMIGLLQGMVCMALIPPMQVHLLNITSKKPLLQQLGHHQMEICMTVVNELRKTYFGAEVVYRLFRNAQKQMQTSDNRSGEDTPMQSHFDTSTTWLTQYTTDEFDNLNDIDPVSVMWNSFSWEESYRDEFAVFDGD
ncbi:Cutinase transcription factor 1 alpha [Talaromyces islandicus]|uniref:Cutinase transcription factor 1 alpha n=1 Tax=Talaromyces islandicus TaxID=28573 RepID=A0A0U1LV80_TALIS|nr:Cutinase transcription factor 1 alpha [Talaromyces islandicus]